MLEIELKNRKPNIAKLHAFGFAQQEDVCTYSVALIGGQMTLTVTITQEGRLYTEVVDNSNGEEYVLHRVPDAAGAFVGRVKAEYEAALEEICFACFEPDVFKSRQAKEVISYAAEKYGDEPEFLWQKFPDNAIFRRKDTGKWYAALLTVSKRKLGFDSDEMIEILDLRMLPEKLEALVDHRKYFPGYHMNKKHWYTVCLDGAVPIDELCHKIDESYLLAVK